MRRWGSAVDRGVIVLMAGILALWPESGAWALSASDGRCIWSSDGQMNDLFGSAMSADGDWLAVGAPDESDTGASQRGAVYLYARNQGGTGMWGEVKKITASDCTEGDQFGYAVALSSNTLAVGAYQADAYGKTNWGAVYIFERDQGGADQWGQAKKIANPGWKGDLFGLAVALDGDTLVVGAPAFTEEDLSTFGNQWTGTAYIYERNQGGASNWGFVKRLLPNWWHYVLRVTGFPPIFGEYFGTSVSVDGDVLAVGSPQFNHINMIYGVEPNHGSVTIFERNEGGAEAWGETSCYNGQTVGRLGYCVKVKDGMVYAGETHGTNSSGGAQSGVVRVYRRKAVGNLPSRWWEDAVVEPASGDVDAASFGCSLDVQGDNLMVGANRTAMYRGAAYLFQRSGSDTQDWVQVQKIEGMAGTTNIFGTDVALAGQVAFASAMADNGPATSQGAVYAFSNLVTSAFTWSGTNGVALASGEPASAAQGTDFGCGSYFNVPMLRQMPLTNALNGSLYVRSASLVSGTNVFSLPGLPCRVGGNGGNLMNVIYMPNEPGVHTAVVAITHNATNLASPFLLELRAENPGWPVIFDQPDSVSVHTGSNATFAVSAIGAPPMTYQWRRWGSPISGARGVTFTTNNSAGNYDCVISNAYGSVTSETATLSISTGTGYLQVDIEPPEAVAGGATWRPRTYGWMDSGTPLYVADGGHQLEFTEVDGYQPVADLFTTVTNAATNHMTITYAAIPGYRTTSNHYVSAASANPLAPYTNWAMAARDIQSAVDVADPGDTVWVTNGVYAEGGRFMMESMNRVALRKQITLQSVNGAAQTIIRGGSGVGGSNDIAARGVWMTNGAALVGFTVAGGNTPRTGREGYDNGGGIWCGSARERIVNCIIVSNRADMLGGGVFQGHVVNSILQNNTAGWFGGGAAWSVLSNCRIENNQATYAGGGTTQGALTNCLIVGNQAANAGGIWHGSLVNCTISGNTADQGSGAYEAEFYNSIVYGNLSTSASPQHAECSFNYSCSDPQPDGIGNILDNPSFANAGGGDYRLTSDSPCKDQGSTQPWMATATDLSGRDRIVNSVVDMGAYEYGAVKFGAVKLGGQAVDFGDQSATGELYVATDDDLDWTVTTTDDWITATGQAGTNTGRRAAFPRSEGDIITGAGRIVFSLADHTGEEPRYGYVVINGVTCLVQQAAAYSNEAIDCGYALSSNGCLHASAPATGSFEMRASTLCTWDLSISSGSETWLTLQQITTGRGTDTVTYALSVNDGPERTGTIYAADQMFVVTQSGSDGEPDNDTDGLPDSWEIQYYGHINVLPTDMASNQVNTVREAYWAGLDPTDPEALFSIGPSAAAPAGGYYVVQWNSMAGRVYDVYWASNLLSGFTMLHSMGQMETSQMNSWTDLVHQVDQKSYYQIRVHLP